jgi:choline dehydrogenase-like flavoprotein
MKCPIRNPAEKWDVIVVGAGPGGAAASKRCAEAGLWTLVLEKRALPRDNCCLTNMIVKTNHDHNRLSIPSDLSRRYHSAIKEIGRPLKDPERILSFLKTMVQELKKTNFSG